MQISPAGIILRASRSLLETFGNDFIAADFDKHFELVEEQISLADLFHAPGSIPERLRVKHRSTEIERVSLVDPVKTEMGAIAGLHLVFMLPAEGDESSEDPSTNQRPSHIGMGLGKHFANAVRQPLGRILANAETIGSELNGPILEQYSSYAKDIASAAKHLSELVGDLEDLDAIDRPEFKVAREPIELGDIARRVVGLLALKAADHQITLVRQLDYRIDKLADIFDFGLHVHGDDDVERVFNLGDEIHDGQAVPLKIAGKGGCIAQLDAFFVERLDQFLELVEHFAAVSHQSSLTIICSALGRRLRRQKGDLWQMPIANLAPYTSRRLLSGHRAWRFEAAKAKQAGLLCHQSPNQGGSYSSPGPGSAWHSIHAPTDRPKLQQKAAGAVRKSS